MTQVDMTAQDEMTAMDTLPNLPLKGEHPMLDIPFVVGIDGRQFRGERLSLVMAEITGLMDPALGGAIRLMRFVFPFQGFSVTLDVKGQVNALDRDKGTATVSFVDPAGEHLPQLRHLLNSYIAGDMVALGDVIGVASVVPSPAARAAAKSGTSSLTFGRILGSLGMLAATLVLVAAVGSLAYKRVFTLNLDAPGVAVRDGLTLSAVAAGQVDYVNPAATKGEVAFTIRSTAGELLSIAMPCDCTVSPRGVQVGETVRSGQPIIDVHLPDAPLVVTTDVPVEQLLDLAFADHVNMVFADGTVVTATVDPASLQGGAGAAIVPVRLIPQGPVDAANVGQLVRLTVIRKPPFTLPNLAGFVS